MCNVRSVDEAKRRLDEMVAEFSGKTPDFSAEAQKKAEAYNAAFWETMHTGMPQNNMKEGSDGAGGYLVTDTFENDLVQALSERNVIRQVATTIPTTHKMHIPIAYGMGDAQWVIEGQPWNFSNASFGEVILDAHKLGTSILASDEMLEDGGVDLEKHIRSFFAERIGEAEEEAFIHGNGKGKPLGLIHQADVGAESELEGEITIDDMANLEFSLRRPYRENAVWLISEEAYGRLRCVRQYNGRLLWNENLQEGEPQKLFGHPIYVCKALDKVAPGSIPVMFGDFRYYWIGDRGKRVMKRLVERYADRGQVAFIATERVDAKLVLPEAVKMLKISGTPAAEAEA